MFAGTNQAQGQAHNQRTILGTIRIYGPLSRADIARHTRLNKKTVTNIAGDLIRAQLIVQKGMRPTQGGEKPSINLELNASGAYTVGLNLERDRLTGVLINLVGDVQQHVRFDLAHLPTPDEAIPMMREAVEYLCNNQKLARERLWGVGIGLLGPRTEQVNPKASSDLTAWYGIPAKEMLSQSLELPVFIENDVTAAAIGERWYEAGQTTSIFLYISFGLGLGGAVMLNGQPLSGVSGFAGELNDIPINSGPESDASGQVKYLGGCFWFPAIYEDLKRHGVQASALTDLEALYNEHNPHLLAWFDNAAKHLASARYSLPRHEVQPS